MGKLIGAAEFKAHCLRILDEVAQTGEPVTVTKRGRPVAEVKPVAKKKGKFFFGCMKDSIVIHGDIVSPVLDPAEVHANDPSKWNDL